MNTQLRILTIEDDPEMRGLIQLIFERQGHRVWTMPHPKVEDVARYALVHFEETIERLGEYLRYPAISCEAEHTGDVRALAQRIRTDLEALGFDRARLCEMTGALPLVAAERLRAAA